MTTNNKSQPKARGRAQAQEDAEAPDMFQSLETMFAAQEQLLGFASTMIESMRLASKQAQLQLEYFRAIAQCKNVMDVAAINTDFARRMTREGAANLEQIAGSTERWITRGDKSFRAQMH